VSPSKHLSAPWRLAIGVILGACIGCSVALFVWGQVSNHERISEIQRSRVLSAESSCEQQNERHERLYAQIEATAAVQRVTEPAKYRATVAKARELEALVNAIQPSEDCAARARLLVEETLGHTHVAPQKPIREPGPLRLAAPEMNH
jgi:hypothetical protein